MSQLADKVGQLDSLGSALTLFVGQRFADPLGSDLQIRWAAQCRLVGQRFAGSLGSVVNKDVQLFMDDVQVFMDVICLFVCLFVCLLFVCLFVW
jgi:hypothetical protein